MKAVRFDEYGGVDVLEVREVEDPVAGPGQALSSRRRRWRACIRASTPPVAGVDQLARQGAKRSSTQPASSPRR
jgi:NADPH:quinone reductase-like Zn-dependent oxidoreductase